MRDNEASGVMIGANFPGEEDEAGSIVTALQGERVLMFWVLMPVA